MVELRARSSREARSRLHSAGVREVPGAEPVKMASTAGAKPTIVFSVIVPDEEAEKKLRRLSGFVAAYGDPAIEPL